MVYVCKLERLLSYIGEEYDAYLGYSSSTVEDDSFIKACFLSLANMFKEEVTEAEVSARDVSVSLHYMDTELDLSVNGDYWFSEDNKLGDIKFGGLQSVKKSYERLEPFVESTLDIIYKSLFNMDFQITISKVKCARPPMDEEMIDEFNYTNSHWEELGIEGEPWSISVRFSSWNEPLVEYKETPGGTLFNSPGVSFS